MAILAGYFLSIEIDGNALIMKLSNIRGSENNNVLFMVFTTLSLFFFFFFFFRGGGGVGLAVEEVVTYLDARIGCTIGKEEINVLNSNDSMN